jgi:hypothetical protein
MTDPAAIIADYEANEAAARRHTPGGMLLEDDVRTCLEMAAEKHGVTYEVARDILKTHWIKEPV